MGGCGASAASYVQGLGRDAFDRQALLVSSVSGFGGIRTRALPLPDTARLRGGNACRSRRSVSSLLDHPALAESILHGVETISKFSGFHPHLAESTPSAVETFSAFVELAQDWD